MGVLTIRVPDVGEGIAEAELVEWAVAVGDQILEDDLIAAVMTDKATVEIPSSATGTVVWLGAEAGDTIAIGADLVRIEVDGDGDDASSAKEDAPKPPENVAKPSQTPGPTKPAKMRTTAGQPLSDNAKPLASPSVCLRAREAGLDLRLINGTGPAGTISHADIDAYLLAGRSRAVASGKAPNLSVTEIPVTGLRRMIAERMSLSWTRIPHITIVEEVDVTALESLRAHLNETRGQERPRLTMLPIIMAAMVRALGEQPDLNAHFDDEVGVVRQYGCVHIGIAAQTINGLVVPVVRHCEARTVWDMAAELTRVSDAAKSGEALREELSGSTVTITSLGAFGALVTTPIINRPEVAIVGVNRMAVRPRWTGSEFAPRTMMNLSSSFDHRVVDGWDAAVFVKRLKTLLESPALIFIED